MLYCCIIMKSDQTIGQRSFWHNKTVLILTFSHFSHDLCFGILPSLIPFIRDALGLDYLQTGALLAALTITAGLSQFFGGWLGDRFRRSVIAGIGLVGVSLCTFIVGFTSHYALLIFIFIIFGIFAGLYHPSSIILLSDSIDNSRQGKAIASHMFGGSLGYLIAPLLGGVIASSMGWQAAFMLLCIPALIASLCVLVFLSSKRSSITSQQKIQESSGRQTSWYRLITLSSMSTLLEVFTGAAVAFFALFLVDVQGLSPSLSTLGLALLRGGGLVGAIIGGYITDLWGNNRAVFLSFVLTGPLLLLLSYLNAFPFFFTLFFFGLFYTMREVTVQAYLVKITPFHIRSRFMGVYHGFSMEGSSLMQPIVGHVMDRFGIISVYIWLGIVSTFFSILMPLLMFIGIKKRRWNI